MIIKQTIFSGVTLINPIIFPDSRGRFLETYQYSRYSSVGISDIFVQDNLSWSRKGVLRGLHFQIANPQAQLVTVIKGLIYDVVVDLRKDSATFKQWFGIELGGDHFSQIYMAPGFAHGFYVLSDEAVLYYKVTKEYDPLDEAGLLWNDREVSIDWPAGQKELTSKDLAFPSLKDLAQHRLPQV